MSGWVLLAAFAVATLAGWRLLGAVPSLLHTPLMSGMNALSGITVVAAVAVASSPGDAAGRWLAAGAAMLAMINVTAGFVVTDRMLRMFSGRRRQGAS
ncbi:MAG: NAD(P) transhydrogenase subunit alpha [Planctomycetes bacterium]|nr:NAD(P) transhydrogenase subunit alpha [Planctomycetota bacterium]